MEQLVVREILDKGILVVPEIPDKKGILVVPEIPDKKGILVGPEIPDKKGIQVVPEILAVQEWWAQGSGRRWRSTPLSHRLRWCPLSKTGFGA